MVKPRTAFQAVLALLCAGALALAASGCGSGGASLASVAPIAQAATATAHSGGSQIAMSITVSVPGLATPLNVTGGGNFNMKHREGQLDFQISGLPAAAEQKVPGGSATFTELFKDDAIYMSSPLFGGKLPNGARWVKVDLAQLSATTGFDLQSLTGGQSNPVDFLQFLRGAGSVHDAGRETVRGTATTRYDGTLDVEKAIEQTPASAGANVKKTLEQLVKQTGLQSVPFSVWIDDHRLVRRMKAEVHVSTDGQSATADVEFELFAFGPTEAVNPPAPSETFDATGLSQHALSSSG